MSFRFNANGDKLQHFDSFVGKATFEVFSNRYNFLGDQPSDNFTTGLGTVIRYGVGGGMDTTTYANGSKTYHFSDGHSVATDSNGKYLSSEHSWHTL